MVSQTEVRPVGTYLGKRILSEEAVQQPMLEVSLDTHWGVSAVAQALHQGKIAVVGYGTTYGTAFLPEQRDHVAQLRHEKPDKTGRYEFVSMVGSSDFTIYLANKMRLHPEVKKYFRRFVKAMEDVSFVRFPASPLRVRELDPEHYGMFMNDRDQIQMFPAIDPIAQTLYTRFGRPPTYLVRSANMSGKPEEISYEPARTYAKEIGAAVFATLYRRAEEYEPRRLRTWSQPIIQFPGLEDEEEIPYMGTVPVFKILRRGSTSPQTLAIWIKHHIPHAVVRLDEAKEHPDYRITYPNAEQPGYAKPGRIRRELKRASQMPISF